MKGPEELRTISARRPVRLFFSYSHRDEVLRDELAVALSGLRREGLIEAWHDRRIEPGADWASDIDEQIRRADLVLLLISPDFIDSDYCFGIESACAVDRHLTGLAKVVPIIMRPTDWKKAPVGREGRQITLGVLNALPRDGRAVTTWNNRDEALLAIAEGLRGSIERLSAAMVAVDHVTARPVAVSGEPTVAPATPERPAGDRAEIALNELASALTTSNAVFFVGMRTSNGATDLPPPACEIARELFADLHLVDRNWDRLLPPLDVAGSYFALHAGRMQLEQKVARLIGERSRGIPPAQAALASLFRTLADRRAERPDDPPGAQVIVTTNADVLMERALLRAGLSFTRIVPQYGRERLQVNEYVTVSQPAANRIRLQPPGRGAPAVELDSADVARLDALIGSYERRIVAPASASAIRSNVSALQGLALRELAQPVLYKLRGSYDVPGSMVLSSEQYCALFTQVSHSPTTPTEMLELIANSPLLFIGYSFLDSDFRLLYHALRQSFDENDLPHYALQLPPDLEPGDNYRLMERGMWQNIKESALRDMGITTLEARGEDFLDELRQRVAVAP